MSLLGKYTDNFLEDELEEQSSYTTPAVLKDDEDISLKKSILISAILHPTAIGVWTLVLLILSFMGITFKIFEKPKPKVNDIEFVLVDKEETPINKKTPYRADINSRAGGHHDPNRKVSMPSPSPGAPQQSAKPAPAKAAPKKQAAPQNPLQKIVKQVTQQVQPAPAPKKAASQPAPGPKAPQVAKPAPPTARPSLKPPTTPRPTAKPSSAFTVPVPKGGTGSGRYSTGPISGSGTSAKGGGGGGSSSSGSGRYAPAPSLAPTGGSGSKLAKGGNESKRVVLLFKIAKDGRLLSCSVFKSSGLPGADKAAINAVQATAPFRPLPAEFKGQSIDIQFTFDYNVFGASGY